MIIRGGENIYPKEIEEFIYTHPKVKDVQVIGVPDKQYGEEIMACIVLNEGETSTEEEMKQFVLDHMAKHKVPRYVRFVEGFPMNVAGKILKYKMREEAVEYLNLKEASEIETYLYEQHQKGNNDQYIQPVHVKNSNYDGIKKEDYIFIVNFREDRIRQIGKKCGELNCNIVSMIDIANVKSQVLYPGEKVPHTLSEYLSKLGLKQMKISESTKYAHLTYFLNGCEETPFNGEDRIHLKTIKTSDYSKTPKMRAKDITKQTILAMKKNYDAIIVNYSNADMLGHTGNYEATVKSIEFLDKCLNQLFKATKKLGYLSLITADHGNAEKMRDEKGEVHTAHTLNKVFCAVVGKNCELKKFGSLQDVAPTFLDLMGVKPNKFFDGQSLIINAVDNG